MKLTKLPALTSTGCVHVVIETPRGSRNKYDYDPAAESFRLGDLLVAGASFPYDFGFIPSTTGEDGDPLDVLVLMDEAAFPGCLIEARLVGIIEAEQTETDGEAVRNDRLIAVAEQSLLYREVQTLDDVNSSVIDGVIHFFTSYNEFKGKTFRVLGRYGPKRALAVIESAKRGKKK